MTDLITPLNRWLAVVREEDIAKIPLVTTTRDLKDALSSVCVAVTEEVPRTLHPYFSEAHQIIQGLITLSGLFLWDSYSDDDTDGPCDVEWDVHHLQKALDPSYVIPNHVEPAFVLGHAFPPPEDYHDE